MLTARYAALVLCWRGRLRRVPPLCCGTLRLRRWLRGAGCTGCPRSAVAVSARGTVCCACAGCSRARGTVCCACGAVLARPAAPAASALLRSRCESAGAVTDCESAGKACRAGCAGCPRSAGAAPVRGAVCCACVAGCEGSSRLQRSGPSRLHSRRLESRRELAGAVTDCESAGEACGAGCAGCPHSAAAAAAAAAGTLTHCACCHGGGRAWSRVRQSCAPNCLGGAGGWTWCPCAGGCGRELVRNLSRGAPCCDRGRLCLVAPPAAIGGRRRFAASVLRSELPRWRWRLDVVSLCWRLRPRTGDESVSWRPLLRSGEDSVSWHPLLRSGVDVGSLRRSCAPNCLGGAGGWTWCPCAGGCGRELVRNLSRGAPCCDRGKTLSRGTPCCDRGKT